MHRFPHAGFWIDKKRDGDDPAGALLGNYAEAVVLFRPRAFLLENVPGLTFSTHRRFLESFVGTMKRAGYSIHSAILKASDFGIAQERRRLFLVGLKGRSSIELGEGGWESLMTILVGNRQESS